MEEQMNIQSREGPEQGQLSNASLLISVVIPAFNEEPGIAHAVEEIGRIMQSCVSEYELIVVDDGSRDNTFEKVCEVSGADKRVKGIRFSRNFGKESAILAGLNAAGGNAVITIDSDLQHPPALIPEMIERWRQGAKVVHAVKSDRSSDSAIARLRASLFNGMIERLGGVHLDNASDFKLLDRVAVDVLTRELPERGRFYRGLADWIGFQQVSVPFTVASRSAGEGKWSVLSLVGLAITALVSFTKSHSLTCCFITDRHSSWWRLVQLCSHQRLVMLWECLWPGF